MVLYSPFNFYIVHFFFLRVNKMLSNLVIAKPVSSVTPAMSSVVGALKLYIMSKFPKGFIEDFYISTKVPLREVVDAEYKVNTISNVEHKKLPLLSMSVTPVADFSDFARGTEWEYNSHYNMNYKAIFRDDDAFRHLGFDSSRLKLQLKITLVLESDLKAWEVMLYLKNSIPFNKRTFINNVVITNEIPTDIIRTMWFDLGLSRTANPTDMNTLQNYLSAISAGHIERITHTSSKRESFCFNSLSNLVMSLSGPPSTTVNREGNIIKNAEVSFDMEIDFPLPMAYCYVQEETLQPEIGDDDILQHLGSGDSVFFSVGYLTALKYMEGNLIRILFTAFRSEDLGESPTSTTDDTIFLDLLDDGMLDILKVNEVTDNNLVRIWAGDELVDPNKYTFDIETMKLSLIKEHLLYNHKYYIAVYTDLSNADEFYRNRYKENFREVQKEYYTPTNN